MSSSIRDKLKIGKRSVRSSLTKQVFDSRKSVAREFEPIEYFITYEDELMIKSIKKMEKAVVEELKERKTMEGYIVFVQGIGESCSNKSDCIYKSEHKSRSGFNMPSDDKYILKDIRENVQKCKATIRYSKTNEVNFIIVNDSFMLMKESKSLKKRERKFLEKCRCFDQETINQKSLIIHENKKILKFYQMNKENCKIISAKKFNLIYESYLKPFSVDFHRKRGIPIPKEKENFLFSIVSFDDKNIRKYCKSLNRKSKIEYHEFSEDMHKKPDVHKIELKSSGNVPIFLDNKEREYLRIYREELNEKYIKMVENLKKPKMILKEIPIPCPPKEHKNCIVCFKVYDDYIRHIEGKTHVHNINSEINKDYYKTIDRLCEEMSISSLKFDNSNDCNLTTGNDHKSNQSENSKQSTKESCTKSDSLTADNNEEKSRKQYEQEYDKNSEINSLNSYSIIYCDLDQSKDNSDYTISRNYKSKIEQSFEANSKLSFIIEDNSQFRKFETCVIEISSDSNNSN